MPSLLLDPRNDPAAVPPTVLVIDDDSAVRSSLEMLLEAHGFQVALARDGRQGLAAFRTIAPDIVLTDIMMPQQDGVETVALIRRECPNAKIVIMSSSEPLANVDLVSAATMLGANVGLHKPFDPQELIDTICTLLKPGAATPAQSSAA
jgi:two-component system, chemotaxis family, chemotaxis protein CheY